ncbi:uncharacterized protein LOC116416467 [Nasonia vitripennis]|uniref:DNA-directed DNA polymerase n=1 Tax=Nasonia vitripennis TaxID=7425 RepID=A0A7M7Q7B2_NASVI|nr:uncharacterized protein LOC116416467 [Nasonia vitripennis]
MHPLPRNRRYFGRCGFCGDREYVLTEEPVKKLIDIALTPRTRFAKVICIAHNPQGFDTQFIFKHIVELYTDRPATPSVIMNGSKIILMEIMDVKFIDSLNYFHMPFNSLPNAYGLPELEKDVFPYLFNIPENQNYIGPVPSLESYAPDTMSINQMSKFLEWYNEQTLNNYIFTIQQLLSKRNCEVL